MKEFGALGDRTEDYGMGSIVCSLVCGAYVLYMVSMIVQK